MISQRAPKQIIMSDNSTFNENPHQLDVALRSKPKPSQKRKIFPDDSTRIIPRIKKKLLPNMELSFNTSVEIDNFIKDLVEIFEESLRDLTRHKRPKMLTVHELVCATRLVLPPELAQRAMIAGERAVLEAKSNQASDVSVETADIPSTSSKVPGVQKNTIETKKSGSAGDLIQSSDVPVETYIPSTSSKAPGKQNKLIRKKKCGSSDDINFCLYILRLKKLILPGLELSKESLAIINNMLADVIKQFHVCLRSLCRTRKTLSVHDLDSVTKLCLPPVLGESAKAYGRAAVATM